MSNLVEASVKMNKKQMSITEQVWKNEIPADDMVPSTILKTKKFVSWLKTTVGVSAKQYTIQKLMKGDGWELKVNAKNGTILMAKDMKFLVDNGVKSIDIGSHSDTISIQYN